MGFNLFILWQRNDSKGMSKRSYIEAVVQGLRAVSTVDIDFGLEMQCVSSQQNVAVCNGPVRKKIYVRLLLSIDRRESTADAIDTVWGDDDQFSKF